MTEAIRIWAPLGRPELALLNEISDLIFREEWLHPDALNSVRRGPTMLIASDYGGTHRAARYETLAFLVADLAFVWLWDEFRRDIRRKFMRDRRRLSYKQLGDRDRTSYRSVSASIEHHSWGIDRVCYPQAVLTLVVGAVATAGS